MPLTRGYTAPSAGGGGGVTDHGALTGLGDDDHPQYLLRSEVVSNVIDCIVVDAGAVVTDAGNVVFDGSHLL